MNTNYLKTNTQTALGYTKKGLQFLNSQYPQNMGQGTIFNTMKKMLQKALPLAMVVLALGANAQVKVGTNPTVINSNAIFEMQSTNKGMLLPRVALTSDTSASPLTAHVAGMTVYNTATAGTVPNNVTPGYYYNNGTKWLKLAAADAAWLLNGNAGTDSTNFLGTIDSAKLFLKTSNTTAFTITEKGNIMFGANNKIPDGTTSNHNRPVVMVREGNLLIEKTNPVNYEPVTRSIVNIDSTYGHGNIRAISGSYFGGRGLKADGTGYENKAWSGVTGSINVIHSEGDNYSTDFTSRVDNITGVNTDLGFWANNPNGIIRNATGFAANVNAKGPSDTSLHTARGAILTAVSTGGSAGAEAYGLRINRTRANSPGVNKSYGIFLQAIDAINGTTNDAWSIYSSTTAPSFFGGRIGIGATAPTGDLSFGGNNARSIIMERRAANAPGLNFTITASGAFAGGTNYAGGNLVLSSGISTGTGTSSIAFQTATAGTAGTTDNAPTTKMTLTGSGRLGIGTATPTSVLQVVGLPVFASNAAAITGGLTVGAFYHAGDGIVRVVF